MHFYFQVNLVQIVVHCIYTEKIIGLPEKLCILHNAHLQEAAPVAKFCLKCIFLQLDHSCIAQSNNYKVNYTGDSTRMDVPQITQISMLLCGGQFSLR